MEYIELSLKNVKEESKKLYSDIEKKNFEYDLVIFIAKGSFPIGKELALLNNVPLLEIKATRTGGSFKKIIKPFFKLIPKKTLIKLRAKEMNSDYHEVNSDRYIEFNKTIYNKYSSRKNILLVDDSIDSGYSIIETKKALQEYFINANIKTAVFNYMSKAIIIPDFNIYKDTMICGPWSSDSKENKLFLKLYEDWKGDYGRKN